MPGTSRGVGIEGYVPDRSGTIGTGSSSRYPGGSAPRMSGTTMGGAGTKAPQVDTKKLLDGIFGGGSGSMGNTKPIQKQDLTPMNLRVQQDPAMAGVLREMEQAQQGLAAGNDIDAINAMQRQRDVLSGLSKELGVRAGSRGFGPDSMLGQRGLFRQGQRDISGLNANLASDARKQGIGLLGQRAGATAQQGQLTQGQQNFALNQWQAQQQANLAQQQMAETQQQNNFNNQLSLFNTLSNFYSGT